MPRRPDRRKIIDTTTPTLIDEQDVSEEEDEEEMVSLARERMHHEMMMRGDTRTPGGALYASERAAVRRTPGAIAMHNSSRHTSVSTTEVTDAALLGFGLTLTTPVTASTANKGAVAQQLSVDSFSSSSSSSSSQAALTRTEQQGEDEMKGPPLAVNTNERTHDPGGARSYTPAGWTLSKNPHLEVSHGAFSPNTLRLTEDLDNLLLDDEDGERSKPTQHVFRDPMKGSFSIQASVSAIDEADEEPVESWTAPYIFGQDGGQAENVKAKGKFRKAKNEGGRRSRSGDVQNEAGARARSDPSDVAHHAHPKPLRRGQGTKIESGFATSSFGVQTESPTVYQGRGDEDEGRRPLNFGGAFVPPSKSQGGNFRRPVPSTLGTSGTTATPSDRQYSSSTGVNQMGSSQMYGGRFRLSASPFQPMNEPQYMPQFSTGSNAMRYSSQTPSAIYGSITPVSYGNPAYGVSSGMGTPWGFRVE